jgi:hypothetical protein
MEVLSTVAIMTFHYYPEEFKLQRQNSAPSENQTPLLPEPDFYIMVTGDLEK